MHDEHGRFLFFPGKFTLLVCQCVNEERNENKQWVRSEMRGG
jgi:hypothetical protein